MSSEKKLMFKYFLWICQRKMSDYMSGLSLLL